MKIEYDPKADAMYIRLSVGTVFDSDEVRPNVFLDMDESGRVLGIEMLGVGKMTDKPHEVVLEMGTSINSFLRRIASLRGAQNPHVPLVHSGFCAPCASHFIRKF